VPRKGGRESWSTRFLASTVSYFIFPGGKACIS
jgi:hypothetical protein